MPFLKGFQCLITIRSILPQDMIPDIVLKDNADVWVTFVGEGAGYKNVLGFYTYDAENPSDETPKPEDITIVFPNVSAKYSGGSL